MENTYSRRGRRAAAAKDRAERSADCQARRDHVKQMAHTFTTTRMARAARDGALRAEQRGQLQNHVAHLCMNMQGLLRDWGKLRSEQAMHDHQQRFAALSAIQARVDDLLDEAEKNRAEQRSHFAAMLSLAHQQRMAQLNQIRHQIFEMLRD